MQHVTVIETSICWTAVSKQLLLYQILLKSDKPVSCYRQEELVESCGLHIRRS